MLFALELGGMAEEEIGTRRIVWGYSISMRGRRGEGGNGLAEQEFRTDVSLQHPLTLEGPVRRNVIF